MKNNNTPNIKNQVKFKIADPSPIQQVITQPVQFFLSQTYSFRRLYNLLISMADTMRYVYPSVIYLANKTGIDKRTVQKFTKIMKDVGLLIAYQRPDDTNYYRLPSIFTDLRFRSMLASILPACKWIPLIFLSVTKAQLPQYTAYNLEKGTQSIKNKSYSSLDSYIYNQEQDKTRKRVDFEDDHHSLKKERVMKQFKQTLPNEWFKAIERLADLNLTKAGKQDLSIFPYQALEHAASQIKFANLNTLKDPFRFVCKLCYDYCKANDIMVDKEFIANRQQPLDVPRFEKKQDSSKGTNKVLTSAEVRQREIERDSKIVKKIVDIDQEKTGLRNLVDLQNINVFAQIVLNSIESKQNE